MDIERVKALMDMMLNTVLANAPENKRSEILTELCLGFFKDSVMEMTIRYMFMVDRLTSGTSMDKKEAEEFVGGCLAEIQEVTILKVEEMKAREKRER